MSCRGTFWPLYCMGVVPTRDACRWETGDRRVWRRRTTPMPSWPEVVWVKVRVWVAGLDVGDAEQSHGIG